MDLVGLLSSVIIGAVASVIASYIFRMQTAKKVPILEVGKDIIKGYNPDGRKSIKIKIINKAANDIINIDVKLMGVNYKDPSEKELKITTALSERMVPYIAKEEKKQFGDNVVILHLYSNNDSDLHAQIDKFDDIMLFIKAEDPYNNAFGVIYKSYDKKSIKDNSYTFHDSRKLEAIKA